MTMPKCKHNVTLDSECVDCIEIKTDNSQVIINQDKKIAELEQENIAMERQVEIITTTTATMNDTIYSLEQKIDEQIACISKLERFSYSCLRSYVWDCELDGGDVQDWAVTAGLVKECAYDSKIHHNVTSTEDMEDGDTFFLIVDPIANGESLKQVKADAIREVASDLYDYDIHSDHDAYHACINISKQLLKEGE